LSDHPTASFSSALNVAWTFTSADIFGNCKGRLKMHDWRQPLQPPIQPKLDPGDRLILHSLGVRWDEPEQIEAAKIGGDQPKGISNEPTVSPDFD